MWAFGLLVTISLCLIAASVLSRLLPTGAKVIFWLVIIGAPISFPFWHLLYPSFHEFQKLCASEDRHVVKQVQRLDFLYSQSCYGAFRESKNKAFKGYECEYWPQTLPRKPPNETHYFRFTRGKNWGTSICQSECANRDYYLGWEEYCHAECFDGIEITEPSFKYGRFQSTTPLIEGRLIRTRTSVVHSALGEMVASNEYTYFPYGDGFARILGMSSGSAPTLSCERKINIYGLDFLAPNSDQ